MAEEQKEEDMSWRDLEKASMESKVGEMGKCDVEKIDKHWG